MFILLLDIQLSEDECWDPINQFHPITIYLKSVIGSSTPYVVLFCQKSS